MAIETITQREAIDFFNGIGRDIFTKRLEEEVRNFIDQNKDRIIAETILSISKQMSIEHFGPVVRFEIRTDSK
jgi:hypothetical protein